MSEVYETQEHKPCKRCGVEIEILYSRKYCPECSDVLVAEYKLQEVEKLQAEKEMRFRDRIPPHFHNARMTDFNKSLCDAIETKPFEQGLLLWGGVGVGKTHLSAAIAYDLIMRDISVHRKTFKELLLSIRATFDNGKSEQSVYRPLLASKVLILEDVATTGKQSEFAADTLLHVIDKRIESCKPTIITSNLSPENLSKAFGQRIGSRLNTFCVVKLGGIDKRRMI